MATTTSPSLNASVKTKVSHAQMLLEKFKQLYREINADDLKLPLLKQVYSEDMVFHDSFHHLHGRQEFVDYCQNLYENLRRCDFEFHEQWLSEAQNKGEGQAMLTWTMVYEHPRLNRGKPVTVEGATHIRFNDQIFFHQDYCDGGALLYEHVPVLGTVIQQLKKRLA